MGFGPKHPPAWNMFTFSCPLEFFEMGEGAPGPGNYTLRDEGFSKNIFPTNFGWKHA